MDFRYSAADLLTNIASLRNSLQSLYTDLLAQSFRCSFHLARGIPSWHRWHSILPSSRILQYTPIKDRVYTLVI